MLCAALGAAMVTGVSVSAKDKDELVLYTWDGMVPQEVLDDFEKETGTKVVYSNFDTDETMLEKLSQAKGGDYDVVIADDYIIDSAVKEGLVQKIDKDTVTNFGNINPLFQGQFYDPDDEYTVPYGAGIPLIVYDPDQVDIDIKGYKDLWDESLKDSVAIIGNYRVIAGITQLSMGESMNEEDVDVIAKTGERLKELAPNIRMIQDDNTQNALLNGEASVAFLYTSQVTQALTDNPDLKVVYPEEGLRSMTGTIEKVGEGDLSLRTEVTTADEIGTLGKEFNHMLDYIEDLIAQVIEEEQQKKDAELEALQYQITPHFMYNTLNSIKFAAFLKGEKELAGLIGDFVELLQASINKKGSFLSVADEIHILKNYIHLQDFRYQGSFQVEYEISEEAYRCYIPRLILQPLVENALLHGIDIKRQTGKIWISGKVKEGELILIVKDNGRGMTEVQIRDLLGSREKKTKGLSAVGVPNVKERLELYYGEKGGMKYDSSSNGTIVTVFLPAIYDIPEEGRKS